MLRIDPQTGQQTVLTSFGFLSILFALSENRKGPGPAAKAATAPGLLLKTSKLDQLTNMLNQQHTPGTLDDGVRRHLGRLNDLLNNGVVYRLRPEGRKSPRVVRDIDSSKTPLHVAIAFWMSEYLGAHELYVDLAVCVECGKFFARERRDNVYCSKTCQNRVAYKRKKIFVAGVLREVNVSETRSELRPGICLYHPRFGLGVIEKVQYLRRRLRLKYADAVEADSARVIGATFLIPDGKSAQELFEEVKGRDERKPVSWQEVVDPASHVISARFLSGVRRFNRWEIDHGTKDITFHAVENPTLLAELL